MFIKCGYVWFKGHIRNKRIHSEDYTFSLHSQKGKPLHYFTHTNNKHSFD